MGALYGQSVDTLSATFAPLDDDAQIVAQWVELTLSTPAGSLWSAPEYGLDVRSFVLAGLTTDALALIPTQISSALVNAPFSIVAAADVNVISTFNPAGGAVLKATILVTPKGAADAPITLTMFASAETVQIMLRGLA